MGKAIPSATLKVEGKSMTATDLLAEVTKITTSKHPFAGTHALKLLPELGRALKSTTEELASAKAAVAEAEARLEKVHEQAIVSNNGALTCRLCRASGKDVEAHTASCGLGAGEVLEVPASPEGVAATGPVKV